MKILTIQLRNLNSLRGETRIDLQASPLSDTGLFAITGATGAGKTTLLDAITLALYGRMHRNKRVEEGMSHGTGESLAAVEFEADGGRYLAKWSLRRAHGKPDGKFQNSKREVARWDERKSGYRIIAEKKGDADDAVETVTGLDYDRFTRSVLLAQGDFASFLDASDRDRSSLLEQITGTTQYTLISQKAFERNKREQGKLEDLERQLGEIELLEDADRREQEASLDRLQAASQAQARQKEALEADLQWLQACAEWAGRAAEKETALAAVQAERAAAADRLARLEAHQRTRTFRKDLVAYHDQRREADQHASQAEALSESVGVLDQDLRAAEQRLATARAELLALEADQEKVEEQIDRVIRLDSKLAEKAAQLQTLRQDVGQGQASLKELKAELTALRGSIERAARQIDQQQARLARGPELEVLAPALSRIEGQEDRYREENKAARDAEAKASEAAERVDALARERKQLEASLSRTEAACQELAEQFAAATPPGYAADPDSMLDALQQHILELGTQGNTLARLRQFMEAYGQSIEREKSLLQEIEALQSEAFSLQKELLSAYDTLQQLEAEEQYHRQIYEQQMRIANFDRARQELQPGEPCPICQSTEHPFREHGVTAYVDRAKRDLQHWEDRRQAQNEAYQALQRRAQEVFARIGGLRGEDPQTIEGRLGEVQADLEHTENLIREATAELRDTAPPTHSARAFAAWEQEWQGRRRSLQEQLETLRGIHRSRQEHLARLQTEKSARQEKEADWRLQTTLLENWQSRRREHASRAAAAAAAIQDQLQRLGLDLPEGDPAAAIGQLRQLHADQAAAQQQLQQLQHQQVAREEALKAKTAALAREEGEAAKRQERLERAEAEHDALRRERIDLFGDKDPEREREDRARQLTARRAALQEREEQHQGLRVERSRQSTLLERARNDRDTAAQTAARLEESLLPRARAADFPDLAAASAARLNPEEESELEALQRELGHREAAHRQALADARQTLDQLRREKRTDRTADDLQAAIGEAQGAIEAKNQEIGRIREVLRQDKEARARSRQLGQRLDAQRQVCRRWARLNELIGSADGKKFRVFAQGLTLKTLVSLANRHLRNLEGRYRIRRRPGSELELDIIDTYQADNIRSMNTLSGGERFLVSLALALGLSDLSGRRNNIRSLFIDEGFGTLDKQTLDLALQTLENLRATGKTIGIISHVEELKERIAVQIQVSRIGNGVSAVDIVGG